METISQLMHDDVRWHGHDEEDPQGGCRSRAQATAFMRDAKAQGITVQLIGVHQTARHVLVVLQATWPGEDEVAPHGELVTVGDGKITSIIVYATVQEAADAAA